MKAADVSDDAFLAVVREFNATGQWAQIWDMEARFPEVPTKVLQAKAKQLMKRGLIGGCSCGCRGDYATPDSDLFY